jgi:hypothetical protein
MTMREVQRLCPESGFERWCWLNAPSLWITRRRRAVRLIYWSTDPEWYVDVDEKPVALLSDPNYYDMFWFSWAVKPLTENLKELEAIYTFEEPNIVYRHKRLHLPAGAFPAGMYADPVCRHQAIKSGRIVMRALGLAIPSITFCEERYLRRRERRRFARGAA